MNWNRQYHYFLLFGDTINDQTPWNNEMWQTNIQPKLDTLLKHSTHYKKTGLRTIQYVPKQDSGYYELLKMGRLTWNDSSHKKWTLTATESIRRFHGLDIWTPSRSVCEQLGSSPDIYFNISNERLSYNLTHTEFEWFVVLAVATDIDCNIRDFAIDLSQAMSAKKTVYMQRGWEEKMQETHWHFINGIQDTFSFSIYNGASNDLHKIPFQDIQFTPFWEIIHEA